MRRRANRGVLGLMVVGLTAFVGMAGVAETAKKPKKAKKVTISGKLGVPGVAIDEASAISMTFIIKGGEPRKLKNVTVTYSYECSEAANPRTGVAYYKFPEPIDVDFEPGRAPDRSDYEYLPPESGTTLSGDVTRKGTRAFGQIFVGFENFFCGNNFSDFTATK